MSMSLPLATQQLQQSVMTAALARVSSGAALWQLIFAFFLGGMVFSTYSVAVSKIIALGTDNVQRVRAMFSLVVRRTWRITVTMLGAASMALFSRSLPGAPCVEDDSCEVEQNRWAATWRILKTGFSEARRTATEGVVAIKNEFELISSAVGVQGLVTMQYVVDRLTPLRLQLILEEALAEALEEVSIGGRRLILRRYTVGKASPQLLAARAYDVGPTTLAFDIDTQWDSEMIADMDAVPIGRENDDEPPPVLPFEGFDSGFANIAGRVPVSVRNVRFAGPVRVVVTHLSAEDPGFGAILVSLPAPPEVGLDVRVAGGEVTRVPFLRSEIQRVFQTSLLDSLLWPRRMVIPAERPAEVETPILSAPQLDELTREDPLLHAEQALEQQLAVGPLAEERRNLTDSRSADFNVNLGLFEFNFESGWGNLTSQMIAQVAAAAEAGVGNFSLPEGIEGIVATGNAAGNLITTGNFTSALAAAAAAGNLSAATEAAAAAADFGNLSAVAVEFGRDFGEWGDWAAVELGEWGEQLQAAGTALSDAATGLTDAASGLTDAASGAASNLTGAVNLTAIVEQPPWSGVSVVQDGSSKRPRTASGRSYRARLSRTFGNESRSASSAADPQPANGTLGSGDQSDGQSRWSRLYGGVSSGVVVAYSAVSGAVVGVLRSGNSGNSSAAELQPEGNATAKPEGTPPLQSPPWWTRVGSATVALARGVLGKDEGETGSEGGAALNETEGLGGEAARQSNGSARPWWRRLKITVVNVGSKGAESTANDTTASAKPVAV